MPWHQQQYNDCNHALKSRLLIPWMIILHFMITPFSLSGQEDSIDIFIRKNLQSHHIPGASLIIIKNGAVIKSGGYGLSNIELNVPASSKSVYEIGSLTKQFTAMAIMMLVEEGSMAIDHTIHTYFPQAPHTWKDITILNLLTHTSGIQNHVAIPGYMDTFKINLSQHGFPDQTNIQNQFFQLHLEFEPGKSWAYDNTGYYLLGLIIEKVTGQSYWTFLENRIFKPLGMKHTRNTNTGNLVPHRASGYLWQDSVYLNQPVLWPFIGFSAGSLMSTVEDLALWDAALYSDKLVSKKTMQKIWQPVKSKSGRPLPVNYGLGWFIDSYHGHRILQHNGGTPGFSSVIYRFPDDTLSVILLTNHADMMIDQLAIDIAGMLHPPLKRPMSIPDPDPALTRRLKKIFSGLLHEKFNHADFSSEMNIFLRTTTGKSLWKWVQSFGELKEFQLADIEKKDGIGTYRYRVQLGENIYLFTIGIGKNGKIVHLNFS